MIFKKIMAFFLVYLILFIGFPVLAEGSSSAVQIMYHPHIQDVGWVDEAKNGEVAGTTGQNKGIEAIEIKANLSSGSSIEYQSHISGIGWEENWNRDGQPSGTTGEARSIEAIKIELTGNDAQIYDVYYRSHISDLGWMDWAGNGAPSGSTGLNRKLQAIQIVIVNKGEGAPGSTTRAYVEKGMEPINQAKTHIQDIGWVESPFIGTLVGTTGQDKAIEALKLTYADEGKSGIRYKMHLANSGWEEQWHEDGDQSGTVGESRQAEAVQIELTGYAKSHYDIYYQAHCSDFGWLNWAKNGEMAGSSKCGKKLEAINIMIVPKDSPAPGTTMEPYRRPIDEESFRARLTGAWLDQQRAEDPVKSYVAGFSKYYMFSGFNQTFNGIEGYYEVLSANEFGGWIRIVDQKTNQPVEIYISFKNIPADHLKITQDGVTRELVLGDTTDGIHYSFAGLKQYGQLAIVELKESPGK